MPDTYNDRLFNGNRARRFLHERRFWWLIDRLRRLHIRRADIIEVGCYDAKTITYLERSGIAVNRYVGYEADADIFDAVQANWAARPEVAIVKSTSPSDVDRSSTFDVGICMETLEHLPDGLVDGYLQTLAQVVRGPVFFTIPVERGAMLLAKQLGYRIFGMYGDGHQSGRPQIPPRSPVRNSSPLPEWRPLHNGRDSFFPSPHRERIEGEGPYPARS
jgi:2-polyprenyl-3-methyl-5-hydroxy-6-metoxy-1,4-benzoquinol methylase